MDRRFNLYFRDALVAQILIDRFAVLIQDHCLALKMPFQYRKSNDQAVDQVIEHDERDCANYAAE